MADPIFARFTTPPRRLLCRHIFGPANPSGDACSRSRPVLAEQLARQLGIDPVWLQLPPGAVALLRPRLRAHCRRASGEITRSRRGGGEPSRGGGDTGRPPAHSAACGSRGGLARRGGHPGRHPLPGAAAVMAVVGTHQRARSPASSHGRRKGCSRVRSSASNQPPGPRRRDQLVATSRAAVRSHLGGAVPLHAFTMRGGLVQGARLRSHPALPVQATATQWRRHSAAQRGGHRQPGV